VKVAKGIGGKIVLCSACMKKVLGILFRVFQFIYNINWKKEISPEATIQLAKGFPILLGPFAKLQKEIISFVMSVPPSFRRHGKIWFTRNGFSRNSIPEYFLNFVKFH
jgi:hypothetical protein